jgi:tripartite-type tricarboxylate transporter receptor subunit TctC
MRGKRTAALRATTTSIAFVSAFLGCSAFAQEDFYKGKTLDLVVGYSAGGGYDVVARLLAAHMSAHIPGSPTIVVRNMPGAGSITAANYIYSLAPKDGRTFALVAGSAIMAHLFRVKGVTYDPRNFSWIGSLTSEVSLAVAWKTSNINKIEDVLDHEFIVGTSGPGGGNYIYPSVLNSLLNMKFKLVSGYPGSTEIALAMERGEVSGLASWNYSGIKQARPTWLADGTIKPLVQLSLRKHPSLPNVPLVLDLAKTQEQRDILEVIFAQQYMARPFIAPPSIPVDRLADLRKAFLETAKDPKFLSEAERARLEVVDTMNNADVEQLLDHLYSRPANILDKVAAAVGG